MDPITKKWPFFNSYYQDHNLNDDKKEAAEKNKRGDGKKQIRDEFIFIGMST